MRMNKATYDSRYFVELFYSKDQTLRLKIEEEKKRKNRYISAIVLHEIFNLSLARNGREVAEIRATIMKKDFQVIPVDDQIAQASAELRHKYNLSMGDSMIAATAYVLKATCISDDPHIKQIKEIETAWI
jgi:predicted nucleic acid-binding protein